MIWSDGGSDAALEVAEVQLDVVEWKYCKGCPSLDIRGHRISIIRFGEFA